MTQFKGQTRSHMLRFPNAKINLGLNVTGVRSDGFHDIETVIFPIPLCDAMEVVPSVDNQVDFQHSGLFIPGNYEENLCYLAYQLLKKEFDLPAVKMCLHKIIPMGAGLGGGSSDAAFTIKMLNELFSLELSQTQMIQFARSLGSDCAFFIENTPVFANGRGDQFEPIDLTLSGYSVVIVVPPVHVSTAEAYQHVDTKKPGENIKAILKDPPGEWKNRLLNDFERTVFQTYPEIMKIKEHLYDAGAIYASMSGSGSAVFGLFNQLLPNMDSFKQCMVWTGKPETIKKPCDCRAQG